MGELKSQSPVKRVCSNQQELRETVRRQTLPRTIVLNVGPYGPLGVQLKLLKSTQKNSKSVVHGNILVINRIILLLQLRIGISTVICVILKY